MNKPSDPVTYSFVIPVFNEEETLPVLHERLVGVMAELDGPSEVVFVDDGSRDASYLILSRLHQQDSRFKVIRFSRNFGHQVALTAGLDFASGQAVVIMDADLQDPPELVPQMARLWREGNEVVYAIRQDRQGETWFKRTACRVFYRFLGKLSPTDIPTDVGDFRLVDRNVVDAVKALRESGRYLRGMFSWVGFRQTGVPYARPGRFAGKTKYSLRKLMRLALDGILSFSNVPLRLALSFGFFVAIFAVLFGLLAIVLKVAVGYDPPGWASLVVVVSFLGGVQLMVMGIIGEYLGRIYEDVRNRPLYIVSRLHGIEPPARLEPRTVVSADACRE